MRRGFTLIELLVVLAVLTVLGGLVVTGITAARNRGRTVACSADLASLACAVERDKTTTGKYPRNLQTVESTVLKNTAGRYTDPWGTPYAYIWPLASTTTAVSYADRVALMVSSMGVGEYTRNGQSFTRIQIISAAPDKRFGPGGEWTPGRGPWEYGKPGADDIGSFNFGNLGVSR